MKDRGKAIEALDRMSDRLPERVFADADGAMYGIFSGNDRSIRLIQGREVLKMIHSAILEHRRLYQITIGNKESQ